MGDNIKTSLEANLQANQAKDAFVFCSPTSEAKTSMYINLHQLRTQFLSNLFTSLFQTIPRIEFECRAFSASI